MLDVIKKPFYEKGFRISQQDLAGCRQETSSTKAPKSLRNPWKQLQYLKKNIIIIKKIRISFPPEHFVTVIVTSNLFFFPLRVCLVYLTAPSVQAIVLLVVSNAYLLISPNAIAGRLLCSPWISTHLGLCERLQTSSSSSKAGLNRQH